MLPLGYAKYLKVGDELRIEKEIQDYSSSGDISNFYIIYLYIVI